MYVCSLMWLGYSMCCSVSSLAQLHACQLVEIGGCVSRQTLVVTQPLLLCVSLLTSSEM